MKIAEYNKEHFFSKEFLNQVTGELVSNLKTGIDEINRINTSVTFINRRKNIAKYPELKEYFFTLLTRTELAAAIKKARSYWRRS
jgi:hypothetical protein